MAIGNSGRISFSASQNFSVVLYWSETFDPSANTHDVSITSCQLVSSNWYGFTYYPNGTISINGTAVASFNSALGSHNCTISTQNEEYPIVAASGYSGAPWTMFNIPGDADGTLSVLVTVEFTCYTLNGQGGSGWKVNNGCPLTLKTVPRTSSISMSSTVMGSTGTISISRDSSTFTHTLTYSFGSVSGTIATKTSAASLDWVPPLSLASQIPNSTSGTCTLTCYTYSGSTLIGTSTATVTLSVPASIKPTITGITAERIDGEVPASWGIYVQTKSKVTLTITGAAGAGGSTIRAYSITGTGVSSTQESVTSGFLNTFGSLTFTGKVCDSRGRWSDEATVSIYVEPYTAPGFLSYSTQRCTSDGTISNSGTYAKGYVKFFYYPCSNNNSVSTTIEYKKSSETDYTNAGTTFESMKDFVFGNGNLSADYSYDIRYTVIDALSTVTVVETLSTAAVLMDFKAGGTGIALGKVSETDNCFEVSENWNVKVYGMLLQEYLRRNISRGIVFATCESAEADEEKVATADGSFTLAKGTVVAVNFTNSNSVVLAKLNVNGTGAKYMTAFSNYVPMVYSWRPKQTVLFIYDGSFYVAVTLPYASTGYFGITKLIDSTSSTSTSLAATAAAVKAAYDRNSWDSITLTNALALSYGGTGATTAAGARSNLGIGVALLFSGAVTTGSATFTNGNYSVFIIIGQVSSTGTRISLAVPRALLTTSPVPYQLTDESYYYSFNLFYAGSICYLEYKGRNNSGQILYIYGVT